MNRNELKKVLDGGVFISSMMGITDGLWVAERADRMCMVQIGAYIADGTDRDHPEKSLLPQSEVEMTARLKADIDVIRGRWGNIPVGLNAAPGDLPSALSMARSFAAAGGDIYELNCHGGYARLLERGLLRAMMNPDQRDTLKDWIRALVQVPIPFVVKFNGTTDHIDFADLLGSIAGIEGIFGVHLNIRDLQNKKPNLGLVKTARSMVSGVLFCSGYVADKEDLSAVLDAGADCVGVAEGLRTDADFAKQLLS